VARAVDLEVPILAVDSDTLTTVERIDELFDQVQIHEPSKAACVRELMRDRFDLRRLMQILDLKPLAATPS
jgi:BioD-like phosphotransacetylase family protein